MMATPEPTAADLPPAVERSPHPSARRGLFIIGLSVACAALLALTIGLASTAFRLVSERTAANAALPTASASPTATAAQQTVQGIEVTAHSDMAFSEWTMTAMGASRHTYLYAIISSEDESQAVEAGFDATAYTSDGRIIDRAPASLYLLPEQKSMYSAIFSEDLSEAATIVVEQVWAERSSPAITGEVITESIGSPDGYSIESTLTSTLSQVPGYSEIVLTWSVDGELRGVCSTTAEIPAGGSFTADCHPEHVGREQVESDELAELPADAAFDAYLVLETPE